MTIVAQNRKARYNFSFLELFESGIELKGSEVKSLRNGKVNISESYAREEGNELFLINSHFSKYSNSSYLNHEETRPRKLLLNRREIRKIIGKLNKESLTLVPTKIFFNNTNFMQIFAQFICIYTKGFINHTSTAYSIKQ